MGVTIIEAAGLLGLDPSTIRWQIRKGKIRAKKVGRDWQLTPREVDRYRREHRRE